ncbi:hypothetical protein BV898_10975 [Hypsibius exemplaris]|uniref:Diphthamide biosynthesis protein 4 n=1 Tax=Hypsibius exemplaris TaxID=2072580 RepID=A0A1W0WI10_HYPEX|nr:hypothetical protein BV898_10975 [Hypsibius exemplaris]
MSSSRPNYYEILEVSNSATPEEIKSNYYRLAKLLHPDKGRGENGVGTADTAAPKADAAFQLIEEAYRILANMASRKLYDADEAACQKSFPIAAYISPNDMDSIEDPRGLSYPCRCGDVFFVGQDKLDSSNSKSPEMVVPCSSCSFAVVLRFNLPSEE